MVPAKALRRAHILESGVQMPTRDETRLIGLVLDEGLLYMVVLEIQREQLRSFCVCQQSEGICAHIAAVMLKWAHHPRAFEPPDEEIPPFTFPLIPRELPPPFEPEAPPDWLDDPIAEQRQESIEELAEQLLGLRIADLRLIAKRRGWKIKGTRKNQIAEQLAVLLADPGHLQRSVAHLRPRDQLLLAMAAVTGNSPGLSLDELNEIAFGGNTDKPPFGANEIYELAERGFLIPNTGLERSSRRPLGNWGGAHSCPRAIRQNLPPTLDVLVPVSDALPPRLPDSAVRLADPHHITDTIGHLLLVIEQDSLALRAPMPLPAGAEWLRGLQEWDYNPNEIVKALDQRDAAWRGVVISMPPPRAPVSRQAAERLQPIVGSREQLGFCYWLLQAAGLILLGSPITSWDKVKKRYLIQGVPRQRAILAGAFFAMPTWTAFWQVIRDNPDLRLVRAVGHNALTREEFGERWVEYRHMVLNALAAIPDNKWIRLSDLFRVMRPLWPKISAAKTFLSWHAPPSWQLMARADSDELRETEERDWDQAQAEYIRALVAGPLHWLGLADVALENGEVQYARFNGLADLYHGRLEALPAPPGAQPRQAIGSQKALAIDGRRITIVPSALGLEGHDLLAQVADLEEIRTSRFVYRLAAPKALCAFESGRRMDDLLAKWELLLGAPMPPSIREVLEQWYRDYGRIHIIKNATLIEVADDFALTEMLAVTSLSKYVLAEISPRFVLVASIAMPELVAELERAGYTPRQVRHS